MSLQSHIGTTAYLPLLMATSSGVPNTGMKLAYWTWLRVPSGGVSHKKLPLVSLAVCAPSASSRKQG